MLISTYRTSLRLKCSIPRPFAMRRASTARSAKALSHLERTATEPREKDLHVATVAKITPVNDRIKLFRFDLKDTKGLNVLSAPSALSTHADG